MEKKIEKKIEDYLHLYLGCLVITTIGEGQLVSITHDEAIYCKVVYGVMGPDFDDNHLVEDTKPILRPLSDITDNEIDELASVLLGKETHCYSKWRSKEGDYILAEWKKEKPHAPLDEKYEYMTMGMSINENFVIHHKWDYHNSGGVGTTNEPLHNHNEITRYLLSKHFDIFGLIDSGLATTPNSNYSND
jgi:hypothetical protein